MWLFSLGDDFAKMLAGPFTWGSFLGITPISLIESYSFNFRVGVIFAKNAISRKRENYPNANFYTLTV